MDTTGITDAGARALYGLKNLTTLDLQGSSVTDAFLDDLAADPGKLPALNRLLLSGTATTDAGRKRLRTARPGIQL